MTLPKSVLRQLRRLQGKAPDNVPAVKVKTTVGPKPLPPVIAAFTKVRWPKGPIYSRREGGRLVWIFMEVTEPYVKSYKGPLFAFAHDDHHYFVVRVDDLATEPLVFRIDHDGSSSLSGGVRLSAFLATVKMAVDEPKPAGTKEQLLEAVRDRDGRKALSLIGKAPPTEIDRSGFTLLHYAAMARLPAVVDALLAAGANPNARLRANMSFDKFRGGKGWRVGREPRKGETPLLSAVSSDPRPSDSAHENLRVLRSLLRAGADPNLADARGRTPLEEVAKEDGPEFDAMTKELIRAGADVNAMSDDGSPLISGILCWSVPRIRVLLAAGADPNRVTKVSFDGCKGVTAVHLADEHILEALLDGGGDPNVLAGDGTTPLALAMRRENKETVRLLKSRMNGKKAVDALNLRPASKSAKIDPRRADQTTGRGDLREETLTFRKVKKPPRDKLSGSRAKQVTWAKIEQGCPYDDTELYDVLDARKKHIYDALIYEDQGKVFVAGRMKGVAVLAQGVFQAKNDALCVALTRALAKARRVGRGE